MMCRFSDVRHDAYEFCCRIRTLIWTQYDAFLSYFSHLRDFRHYADTSDCERRNRRNLIPEMILLNLRNLSTMSARIVAFWRYLWKLGDQSSFNGTFADRGLKYYVLQVSILSGSRARKIRSNRNRYIAASPRIRKAILIRLILQECANNDSLIRWMSFSSVVALCLAVLNFEIVRHLISVPSHNYFMNVCDSTTRLRA